MWHVPGGSLLELRLEGGVVEGEFFRFDESGGLSWPFLIPVDLLPVACGGLQRRKGRGIVPAPGAEEDRILEQALFKIEDRSGIDVQWLAACRARLQNGASSGN